MTNKINFLPSWVETNDQPAFYDVESGTSLQQTARMYAKVNQLIRNFNELTEEEQDFIEQFIDLRDYVEDYFDNLDVQEEINNKLDEMVNNGNFELLFSKYINPYFASINQSIEELDTKVSSLNGIAPTVVSDMASMTDHAKTYVLTTDGKWYYYNGSAFVAGGDYNSDVTEEGIKWYINNVATDGNSIFNPFEAIEGALKTSDGSVITGVGYTDTYWVTDFISLDNYTNSNGYYRFIGFTYGDTYVKYYKCCFYDEDKQFLSTITGRSAGVALSTSTDITNYKYVRLQFLKTDVPFMERYKMLFTDGTDTCNTTKASHYLAVSGAGIASAGVDNSKLAGNLYQNNVYDMLSKSLNPFTFNDFSYGTIDNLTGYYRGTNDRLYIGREVIIPAGTTIELSNDWKALVFTYDALGNYEGRYVSNWTSSIYFPTDITCKLIFANDTIGNVANSSSIINLLSNMSFIKDSGGYSYKGEKVNLSNTFSAESTGLTMAGQDSAIASDGHIISFTNDGRYKVIDISGQQLKAITNLDQKATIAPHSNCASFGTEKVDSGDLYPLVYTNAYNNTGLPKGAVYAYRLKNDLTTELKQQIIVGFTEANIWTGGGSNVRPYGNMLIDTDNNKLYVYTMIDNLNVTRFFKFNLPNLSQGSVVTLQESDIEDYFDVPYFYYIQGGCYYNGKIYASCGFTANDCKLYVVDLAEKKLSSTVPLGGFVGEPETVFVYKNELYLSSGTKLFRLKF